MGDRETTADLMTRLRRHYIPDTDQIGAMPGGTFIEECGINGATGSRCDALYVGFTSASGRILIGHEVKASRSDWLRELAKVGKADTWADQCHRWYLVAPSVDVIHLDEVPHGWGLMVPAPRGAKMQVLIRPETYADRVPAWWAVRSMFARLDTLRAGWELDLNRRLLDEARVKAREQVEREQAADGVQRLTPAQRQALAFVERLETKTGLKVDGHWDEQLTPEVIRAGLALTKLPGGRWSIRETRETATRLIAALDEFDKAQAEIPGTSEP